MKRSLFPPNGGRRFGVQMDGWMSRRRRCRVLSGRSECQLPLPAAPRPSTDRVASNALRTDASATVGRTDLSFIRSHSLAICDHVRPPPLPAPPWLRARRAAAVSTEKCNEGITHGGHAAALLLLLLIRLPTFLSVPSHPGPLPLLLLIISSIPNFSRHKMPRPMFLPGSS